MLTQRGNTYAECVNCKALFIGYAGTECAKCATSRSAVTAPVDQPPAVDPEQQKTWRDKPSML